MSNIAKMIAIAKRFGGGSGPSEVVILPETEIAMSSDGAPIKTAPNAMPEVGSVYAVAYNGTAYDCPAVAIPDGLEIAGVLLGNSDAMGIPGGNTSAPFLVMLFDAPIDETGDGNLSHGTFVPMGEFAEGTTVTISIVQGGAASGGEGAGGGIFEVNVPVTKYNTSSGHDFGEFDKTFAELVAAHNAGKYVRINANWNYGYSTYGYVIGFGKSDGQDTFFVSMPASPTMPKQVAVYMLYAGDDGKIAAQIMGAD